MKEKASIQKRKKSLAARLGAWVVSLCLVVTLIPIFSTPVYAEEVDFTITVGDVSDYEALYGSKGFMQWYDVSNRYGYTWDYIKSGLFSTNTSRSGWYSMEDQTSVTKTWGDWMDQRYYHGIRAQAPAEGYVLDRWKITDTTGKEVTDNFYFYMTETYSATDEDGTRQYLLGLATKNYYGIDLPADNKFVVTPIFVEGSEETDIDTINITMEDREYQGGDAYDILEERATIVEGDAEKYSIAKEQTTNSANVTGYTSGQYIVEPGDSLYYTAAFEASSGYQFANKVDLVVNGKKVAEASSDGITVRFQDAICKEATGGVTDVTFNENLAGRSSWTATADYFGISRSKENLAAEKETEYGLGAAPCTVITFEISLNGGETHFVDFEPATAAGIETFSSTSAVSYGDDWEYTFKAGDQVSWKCYGYNFREDDRMGWEPYTVGEIQSGSFTVTEATSSVITTVDISGATVTGIVDKTYNGKAQTQSLTVKMTVNGTNVTLTNGTDYTISYANNTNVGIATITITGRGNYTGTVSKTFKINAAPSTGESGSGSGSSSSGSGSGSGSSGSGSTGTGGSGTGLTNTDTTTQKAADGTALGAGASSQAAEAAITASASEEGPAGSNFNKLQFRSTKQANKSVTLKWSKPKGAVKYVLYGNACGKKNKMVKITTTTKNSLTIKKIKKKALKKGTYYKFLLVALDKNNKVVSSSKVVHVATKGGKVGNYSKVTTKAKKSKVSLKKGKSFKLGAKQVPASKKLKAKKHRVLKYESTNTKIATVNGKGVIKGKAKGTCYVYAYTQSGTFAKIKVTVK